MIAAVKHVTYFSSTDQGLAVFVLLLVAGAFASIVAAHLIDRGVNPIRDAVSDFGAREHPWPYRLAAIWLGLAGLLTAVILADAMFPKPTFVILCLLLFAAARWAITIFPTDLEDEEETSIGRTHVMLAVAAFGSVSAASLAFALTAVGRDPFWDPYGTLLSVLAGFVTGFALTTGAARINHSPRFGLHERLLYLAMFAWFSAIALIALTG